MEFLKLVEARQSVRAYQSREVEADKLRTILEATNRAPSAGNYQAFEIYVVREDKREALTAATFGQAFIAMAPVSLIFCMNPSRCQYQPPELFAMQDTAIACTFAMQAVVEVGLATCWIGAFDPKKISDVMALPEGVTPVAILPIGYAAETPERTTRRPLNEVVHEL